MSPILHRYYRWKTNVLSYEVLFFEYHLQKISAYRNVANNLTLIFEILRHPKSCFINRKSIFRRRLKSFLFLKSFLDIVWYVVVLRYWQWSKHQLAVISHFNNYVLHYIYITNLKKIESIELQYLRTKCYGNIPIGTP